MRYGEVLAVLGGLGLAACGGGAHAPEPAGAEANGWTRYAASGTQSIACGKLPVLLASSHSDSTLTNSCGYVRIAGEHNDVSIEIAPAGTIEITGAHNDVYWKLSKPGAPPHLLDTGQSNTFHPPL
jgi:hypothetical protein